MSVITDTWHQLVRRRLWPVALLLLGALVAVPVVLAKEPAPVEAPATAAAPVEGPGTPLVALASAEERDERRRVVGDPKDPFAPAPRPAPRRPRAAIPTPTGVGVAPAGRSEPAPSGPGGGGFIPAPSGPGPMPAPLPAPAPAAPAPGGSAPAPREPYSLTVRFGDSTAQELERRELPRLHPLPSEEEPVLVYLGVSEDGERAVFLLDQGVRAQGDGVCAPTPTTCETIELAEGETEFLDVPGPDGEEATRQYQLDIVRIHGAPRDARAARASAPAASRADRASDARTGRVERRSRQQ